jgi:hypothetical protein
VSKKYQIIELVVRIALFERKLNSDELANHVLQCINTRLMLPLCDWTSVQLDRASTNKSAIRKIKENYPGTSPTEIYCCSHGLNNVGKKLFESLKFLTEFRKQWQKVIQFPGKARDLAKTTFKETILQARGVRFYNGFEQAMQILKQGMKTAIIDQIIPSCMANKWSETSALHLYTSFGTAETKANLAMAIFEAAAISEIGDALCKGCYKAEGDSPLILTGDDIFIKVESMLSLRQNMPKVEEVLHEVMNLINETEEPFIVRRGEITETIDALKEMVTCATQHLKELNRKKRGLTSSGTSSLGRSRNNTSKTVDNEQL